jgi:3-methyladenine DNA glycosylase/8-oxoguanine DNA glycosylase
VPDARPSDLAADLRLDFRVDLRLTLSHLRHGSSDPTVSITAHEAWLTARTPSGPATVRLAAQPGGRGAVDTLRVMAWGPGAETAWAALPRLLGSLDDPARLHLPDGRLRHLAARLDGLRFGRSDAVMAALLPAIVEQKVTGAEAQRAWRRLVLRFGEPAPGPGGLWLAPRPDVLAGLAYHELHPLGLEQRRATTLRRAAERADWLEAACQLPPDAAQARLRTIPGVGPWTAAETARAAFGDPDAVSLGDFHTPSLVAWVLAGEPRADDARMLELLEPYRGQRARLVRMLELSGWQAPRFGPRLRPRSIERM